MEGLTPPTSLQLTGKENNWTTYKQRFKLYIEALGLTKESEERKIAIFLSCAREEAVEVYNATIKEKIKQNSTLEKLIEQYDEYVVPRKILIISTYELLKIRQEEGEGVDQFITRIKNKGRTCELGKLQE